MFYKYLFGTPCILRNDRFDFYWLQFTTCQTYNDIKLLKCFSYHFFITFGTNSFLNFVTITNNINTFKKELQKCQEKILVSVLITNTWKVFSMPNFSGPGPGKYMLPPVIGYKSHDISKYRNPQYSMGIKVLDQIKPFGPGPRYDVHYMTPYGKASPPAYSMKSRPKNISKKLIIIYIGLSISK